MLRNIIRRMLTVCRYCDKRLIRQCKDAIDGMFFLGHQGVCCDCYGGF